MKLAGPQIGLTHVGVERVERGVVEGQILGIVKRLFQALLADLAQEQDRIVTKALPEVVIQPPEGTGGLGLPGPPQVVG